MEISSGMHRRPIEGRHLVFIPINLYLFRMKYLLSHKLLKKINKSGNLPYRQLDLVSIQYETETTLKRNNDLFFKYISL